MPHDPLAIALEHHRAGRLQQAAAGYRTILETNPGDAAAMHWTGVLAYQAGQSTEAIFWLEQAAAICASDAAYQHNLAQAYLAAGWRGEAIKTFHKAVAIDGLRAESWVGLGLSYLGGPTQDDANAAVAAFAQARETGLDSAQLHHQLGVALLNIGLVDEAIRSLRTAVARDAQFAPAYHHLALAVRAAGQSAQAIQLLRDAVAAHPKFSPAWHGLAVLEGEAGRLDEAQSLFRTAIALKPDYAAAYNGLAHVLELAGKSRESLEMFRRSLSVSRASRLKNAKPPAPVSLTSAVAALERQLGQDAAGTDLHYALATMTGVFAPPRVPQWAVANLFNSYAENFDQHLRGQLQYRVPEMIAETIAAVTENEPVKLLDILDLGCGTGLCGALLRPMAASLTGVDLAPAMIDKAAERKIYDRLSVGDLVAELQQHHHAFDLLVAADVLTYIGDLAPTFEAARSALRPGGRLIFSVEAFHGERYSLSRSSRRYVHARQYLEHLAGIYGLGVESFEQIVVRLEKSEPVPGYLMLLRVG